MKNVIQMMQEPEMLELKRSVALVGMMGCGKSAIGSRLALKLEVPFIDLDEEIESNENMTITQIFSKYGEEYFRRLEREAVNEILNSKICVLATGGGAFAGKQIREVIAQRAISVYIRAEFHVLLERVSRKKNRPLLEMGDREEILRTLMEKRCPIYETADIIVDSTEGQHDVVVDQIIEGLRARSGHIES